VGPDVVACVTARYERMRNALSMTVQPNGLVLSRYGKLVRIHIRQSRLDEVICRLI
jgi:hypothetical protein